MPASPNSRSSRRSSPWLHALAALLLLGALSAVAANYVHHQGWTLWYGDAEAHLNIARRLTDAREPGYEQIGTVWLPLPHVLAAPLARNDTWWHDGRAGVVPSAAGYVLGGLFLFLAIHLLFKSLTPAWAALGVYALNPNLLYLQSAPMTEPLLFVCFFGTLWLLLRYRENPHWTSAAGAGLFALLGTLTRYDGWFILPFCAFWVLLAAKKRVWKHVFLFSVIAAAGPLWWFAHNQVLYSNALEFYNGHWSAKAIYQRALDGGMARYPGDHDFPKAFQYFMAAARLCLGSALFWLGLAGALATAWLRAWWALAFCLLLPVFYTLSLYSSGTPIFVPHLWPNSYYNTRYGLNLLPLVALGAGALTMLAPRRFRWPSAVLVVVVCASFWAFKPLPERVICWKESQVNSETRRWWTQEAAEYLGPRYKSGAGIFMMFGDLTGILRSAGIPLRESFHESDRPPWMAAAAHPELFLREEWAIAFSGDAVSRTMNRLKRGPLRYECVRMISKKGSPVVEIWRRLK